MPDDIKALFEECWEEQVADRRRRSPSFTLDEYTATGRAPASYGGKRNVAWWLDHGPAMVEKWVQWRAETQWDFWEPVPGEPAIELEINATFPNDINVKMVIDRVFVMPSGELAAVDLKSGRTPEVPMQLGLYASGIELAYGKSYRPKWGYWWTPDKGHIGPFDLDSWTPAVFGELFKEAITAINAGTFLPKPKDACERWCGVSRYCLAVGGERAQGNDPLTLVPIDMLTTSAGE